MASYTSLNINLKSQAPEHVTTHLPQLPDAHGLICEQN